jgi:hypothetical protein
MRIEDVQRACDELKLINDASLLIEKIESSADLLIIVQSATIDDTILPTQILSVAQKNKIKSVLVDNLNGRINRAKALILSL